MPRKALLINPPTGRYIRDDRCQAPADFIAVLRPPIDLSNMAGVLEESSFTCRLKDYPAENKNWTDLRKDIREFKPEMLVVSTTTPTIQRDLQACKIAKETNFDIRTVVKGAHVTAKDREVLETCPELDLIIRQETEMTLKEIALNKPLSSIQGITYRSKGLIYRNDDREFIEDLDSLPRPARHLINHRLYRRPDTNQIQTTIETNRGCPGHCLFCLVNHVSGKKIRSHSPQWIADEMERCVRDYKIHNFYFRADTFTWNKTWTIEVCKRILKKNMRVAWVSNSRVDTLDEERLRWMKKAGCWMLGLGAEHGGQWMLDKIGKDIRLEQTRQVVALCKRFGIQTFLFFMLGFPWEKRESVEETIRFARSLRGNFAIFNLVYPYPGTELYKIGKHLNLFQDEDLFGKNQYRHSGGTLYLSSKKLLELQQKAEKAFYLNPRYILSALFRVRSPRVLWNYIRYGIRMLLKIIKS
jgi:radical SAM superfamily enzyme YgiQ (UPF0313 family)